MECFQAHKTERFSTLQNGVHPNPQIGSIQELDATNSDTENWIHSDTNKLGALNHASGYSEGIRFPGTGYEAPRRNQNSWVYRYLRGWRAWGSLRRWCRYYSRPTVGLSVVVG